MSTENQEPYDSDQEDKLFIISTSNKYEIYKRRISSLVERYFANEKRRIEYEILPLEAKYHHFFVQKLIVAAMQRGDNDKERAAHCLSISYGEVVMARQVEKGFQHLLESTNLLLLDIPDTIDTLAIFVTRALIDEILPTYFLQKMKTRLSENPKALEVIKKVENEYSRLPENMILKKWGGDIEKPENLGEKVKELMEEFLETENELQAYRDIKDLDYEGNGDFNQEVIKCAILTALERRDTEINLWYMLKDGPFHQCHTYKAFDRVVDLINESKLDHVPNVREVLQSLIVRSEKDLYIHACRVKPLLPVVTTRSS